MKARAAVLGVAAMAFAAWCDVAPDAGVATFHVDAAAAAGGDGSAARPWRTVQDAVLGVRRARKAGAVKAGEPVEVVFRAGEHFVGPGVLLGAADSGTAEAPVTWRGEGKAVLTGGVRVPASLFRKVEDPAVRARLPEEARDKVLVADVSSLPGVPGKIDDLAPTFLGIYSAPVLFVNGTFATLARWPNEGFASFTEQVAPGVKEPGAFRWPNPRAKRWNFAEGVWLNGYWTHDWDCRSVKAARFGEENGTNDVMRLAAPMTYGVALGTWGRKDRRFFAFNLLDEVDAPGEWWLDRANRRLYLCPPNGTLAASDSVVLAFQIAPILTVKGGRHIRLKNLAFAANFGDGLWLEGDDLQLTDSSVSCVGHSGVVLKGNRILMRGVEVSNIGGQGCVVTGGDRKTLVKSGNLIEDCHVHDWGVFMRTYAPAFNVGGCGVTLRRNRMHDAPHSAVLYGGNEHLFEYNEVYRVLMETGDAGAYYTGRDWTTQGNVLRYNYTHDLGNEGAHASTMGFYFDDCDCGDAVYGNVFHNVARGIMVGGGRDHPIYGNVFSNCKIGLSIDCRGMTWKHWNSVKEGGESWLLEDKAKKFDYTNGVWAARYPRLANIMNDHPREPLYNPVTSNVFIDCSQEVLALDGEASKCLERMAPIKDNVVVNTLGTNEVKTARVDARIADGFRIVNGSKARPFDVGFADPAHGDFTFKRDAWILRQIPELRAFLDWFPRLRERTRAKDRP